MKKAFGVCILILGPDPYNPTGAIGVARREDPNSFGLIGGKVDPGETEEQAAIRECKEESGVDVYGLKEVYRGQINGYPQHDAVTYTAASYSGNPSTQPGEPECKWCTFQELLDGRFGDYNKKVFEALGL